MSRFHPTDPSRRRVLHGIATGSAALLAAPAGRLLAAAGRSEGIVTGYGPLAPCKDLATGLPLLELPPGFSYRTFGWTGSPMSGDAPTPGAHDGMGVVAVRDGRIVLVRNHEVVSDTGAFGPSVIQYDAACGGGTLTLEIDAKDGSLVSARPSLSGTLQNCAGGITPRGTWLTCEEYVYEEPQPKAVGVDSSARPLNRLVREHGFVFEVHPAGDRAPVALEAMGQFRHEAAVTHAATGDVYLTEDREPRAGFYRFVPTRRDDLAAGGRLQMLKADGAADLRRGLRVGQSWKASWVDIDEPGRAHSPGRTDGSGVVNQGLDAGATAFTRLEGCFATDTTIYFTATNGGDAASGQVFAYHVKEQRLALLFESTGLDAIDYPDNLCFSPRGGLVVCEDGQREAQMLWGLGLDGRAFPLAKNNVVLDQPVNGFTGDFRGAEWAGCCFSPDGKWLFANIYAPGFTVAITGPWRKGLV